MYLALILLAVFCVQFYVDGGCIHHIAENRRRSIIDDDFFLF